MSDLNHFYGGDLSLSATGDILKVDGSTQGQQRVLRRLLTNPALMDSSGKVTVVGDYIWHPTYGAGLPRMVGDTVDIPKNNRRHSWSVASRSLCCAEPGAGHHGH